MNEQQVAQAAAVVMAAAPAGTPEVATVKPSQVTMFGILDRDIAKVFRGSEVKGKDGRSVGMNMTLRKRGDIATDLELKGKGNADALDEAILKQQDEAFRLAKGHIAGLNGDWTLAKLSTRTLASGIRQITLVAKEIKRVKAITDEQMAKEYNIPVADVPAFRKLMAETAAKLVPAKPAIDVENVESNPPKFPVE